MAWQRLDACEKQGRADTSPIFPAHGACTERQVVDFGARLKFLKASEWHVDSVASEWAIPTRPANAKASAALLETRTYQAQTASVKPCMPERGCPQEPACNSKPSYQRGTDGLAKIGKHLIKTSAWNSMERNGTASSSSCSRGRDSRTAIRGVQLPLTALAATPTAGNLQSPSFRSQMQRTLGVVLVSQSC